ncbi:unnamed protein product [Pleuronectes platessa]|uniref:Uncharacterized protein n=1 Tax=Pleuronectes platessa TaxID=8262 RepID=A0A9N7TPB6_PLEPL|nr:unnamed protein product [Pleuronectes platessa]
MSLKEKLSELGKTKVLTAVQLRNASLPEVKGTEESQRPCSHLRAMISSESGLNPELTQMCPKCIQRSEPSDHILRWSGTDMPSFLSLCEHKHVLGVFVFTQVLKDRPLS